MKRKRNWWVWPTIIFGCMLIILGIAELTGTSIASVFGWGMLGMLGAVGIILTLAVGAVFFIIPITGGIWYLLAHLISNREILYVTLGSLGLCAILVGWILTVRQSGWSLPVMIVGFGLGCFAGAEYQKGISVGSSGFQEVIEEIPSNERDND